MIQDDQCNTDARLLVDSKIKAMYMTASRQVSCIFQDDQCTTDAKLLVNSKQQYSRCRLSAQKSLIQAKAPLTSATHVTGYSSQAT